MFKSPRFFAGSVLIALCWTVQTPPQSFAQTSELTAHDNHALLYARQLGFSAGNTPTVRIRIADGLDELKFTPRGDIVVMASENSGPAITLRGNKTYRVTLEDSRPGVYAYASILARAESPAQLEPAREYCKLHHIPVETETLGALFALKGIVFDNRETLLLSPKTPNSSEAQNVSPLPDSLSGDPSNDLYTELKEYPVARIVFKDDSGSVQIANENFLRINLPDAGATLHSSPDEHGKLAPFILNAQLIVTPDQHGKLAVLQSADVETILRGIVPAEIFATAPEPALMAQTIAARTTLIAQAGARHQADPYHLCNHQHCQVYRGLSGAHHNTDRAIQKTRGQILMDDKKPAATYYASHCGGISAGSDETWGLPPKTYLQTLSDDLAHRPVSFRNDREFRAWLAQNEARYCASAPKEQKPFASTKYAHWTTRVEIAQLQDALKKAGQNLGTIQNVEILRRGPSYRATHIRITGSAGTFELQHELTIRRFFGGLKSALFVMTPVRSGNQITAIEFEGAGFGHGVGLCQTGAIGMAQRGASAEDILMHYYPGTALKTIY